MHVHPHRLVIAVALLVGCKSQPAPAPPMPPAPTIVQAGKSDPCAGRPRCSASRKPIADAPGAELVTVRIAHVPDASSDEEHCDRREYWLSRTGKDLLVAVDCEAQWGADNAGPAQVRLDGKKLHVSYTELQSGDACEVYSATVDLAGPRLVEAQSRTAGTLVKDVCKPGKQVVPSVPPGDGTAAHPLLTLHR